MQRWSPITCLPVQTLTSSGLLNLDLDDSEVQLISRRSVELRSLSSSPLPKPSRVFNSKHDIQNLNWNDRDIDLIVTLTTHRIVFQHQTEKEAYFLHNCALRNFELSGGGWATDRSFKITLHTITHDDFYLIFRDGKTDRDSFHHALVKSMARKQWEESSRIQEREKNERHPDIFTRKVGVDAILQRNKNKINRAKELADNAFGDGKKLKGKGMQTEEVEKLFLEAKELTSIIHKYVATLERNRGIDGATDDDKNGTQKLTSMLENMGMITALTKDSSSSYFETLARQIADFLFQSKAFMSSKGGSGIISLTDVYCLFNRARGVNMISPEDLIQSLTLMEKFELGLRMREFDGSGVKYVCESNFDDSVMAQKIIDHVEKKETDANGLYLPSGFKNFINCDHLSNELDQRNSYVGVTILEAARIWKISPILAKEQLISAEIGGYLCRDVTLEGTRFYRNLFTL